jgi:hypothetical protein
VFGGLSVWLNDPSLFKERLINCSASADALA